MKLISPSPGLSVHAGGHGIMPISQTFVFPGDARALTTTDSKFGITAKDVICECSNVYFCNPTDFG